ncbi:MAG TPA: hypothetical protein VFM18_17355 [Methanosarcina sp.]|nr:hypothetical protein [Methanosarcina sp.]
MDNCDDLFDVPEAAELADDDYGFIFDSDGNLKAVYLPNDVPPAFPKNIKKMLKMLNVDETGLLESPTIH